MSEAWFMWHVRDEGAAVRVELSTDHAAAAAAASLSIADKLRAAVQESYSLVGAAGVQAFAAVEVIERALALLGIHCDAYRGLELGAQVE